MFDRKAYMKEYNKEYEARNPRLETRREYRQTEHGQEVARRHKKTNWDKAKDQYLKRNYNISLIEYNKMLDKQSGVCAICEEPEDKKIKGTVIALTVDHDHESGKVRGLLCMNCNMAIGKLKDDHKLLLKAANYLMPGAKNE